MGISINPKTFERQIMILKDLAIILTNTTRSQAYLQAMIKNQLLPSEVILMSGNIKKPRLIFENYKSFFDINEQLSTTLKDNSIKYMTVETKDINHEMVIENVKNLSSKIIIFTGGGILKKDILNLGKKFIHCHPGILPEYRGSTCFYYSILEKGNCGCSVFIMDEKIDNGKVLYQKSYKVKSKVDFDYVFDPWMRADSLIDWLRIYSDKGHLSSIKQDGSKSKDFYIIHPILKHISHSKDQRF